ncbi:MAG TPA: threonine/serine exporter family protein [Candidatus Limiplasma stercoravium]|nr:threonine/serine exporter family protein [Candidatus Limiplasma stercoravium]
MEPRENRHETLLMRFLDMGELLLTSGAEVMRVEDTLTRLCKVYGFTRVDVFTITSSIIVTACSPDGRVLTQTRRIRSRDTDFRCVERVNALSRRLCQTPMEPDALGAEIDAIRSMPADPTAVRYGIYAGTSAVFAVFFGGVWMDGVAAALCGIWMLTVVLCARRLRLNSLLECVVASSLTALAAVALTRLGIGQNADKIIIGNIMLLIPGIAFTTSLRDLINGDTISGLLGLSEAVVKALAIAIGFAAVLTRMGG